MSEVSDNTIEGPVDDAKPSVMPLSAERLDTVMQASERRFWGAVAIAALLHVLLLIGFTSAEPRRVGSPEGADLGISISMISEADLKGTATVEDRAAGAPALPQNPAEKPTQPSPPAATAPPPPKAEAEQPKAAVEPAAAKTSEIEPDPDRASVPADGLEPPPEATHKEAENPAKTAAAEMPAKDKTAEQKATETLAEPPPKPQAEKLPIKKPAEEKTAKLDLTPPPSAFTGLPGGGAGVQRPPGITRSGANDEFARGVIRALQQTMPQFREVTLGRVTVRIMLNMSGNLVKTEVLRPSNVTGLDQSVVFATKQTNFPLPPANANAADLVFVVTYVYR